jgi:uncharacterized repeat protein (TIGR03843 family)
MVWEPHVAEIVGRFVDASNATLLGTTEEGEEVVYKPTRGERPLWDFELETLAAREVLTYEVDSALGFGIVPETVLGDGPFGPGSIQRFVAHDVNFDAQPLARHGAPSLWPIAVLDVVTNNADRKFGHILSTADGLKAIDHGLTFHPEEKLRTVLWVFAGRRLPKPSLAALERLVVACDGPLGRRVTTLLGRDEQKALRARSAALLARGVHPDPPFDRPPIPWPPY